MKNKRRILAVLATFALASFGMGVAACKENNPDTGEFTLSGFEVAAEAKGNFNETFTIPVFAPIDGNGTVYTVTVTVTCGGEAVQVVSNKIVLNRMEDYVITYSVDGTDIVKTMTVSVTDSIAPTVKVTGGALNRWYFAGSSITPPTFSVTDNADSNLGYTIDVFRGDEKVKADVKEAFTLSESGKYTLVASAKDKSDNVGKEEIPFIVREASAKGEVVDFNDAIAFDCVTAWNNNDTSLIKSEYVTFEGKKAIKINSCDANGNPVKYPGLMLAPAVTKAEAQALFDDGFTSITLEYYIDYTASRNIYQKWGEKQSSYTTQLKRWDTVDLPLDIFIENYDSLANGTKSLFFISNDEEWTSDKVRADFDFYVSSAYITKNVEDIKFSDGGLNNVAGIDDEIDVSKITASSETARDMSFAYAVLAPDGTEINLTDGKFIVGDFGVYKVKASSASKCYKGSAEYEITVKASVESVNALINEILTADDITTMGEQAAQLRAYYATLTAAEKETVNFTSYIRAVNLRKENDTLYFFDTVDGKQQIEISCSILTKPTALETNDGVTFVTDVKHGNEAGSTKIEFTDVKTEWFEYFNIELKKPSDIDLSQYPYVRFYIMGYTWDVNRPLTLAVKLNGKRIESMSTPVPIPSNEWYEVLLPVSMFDEGNKVELAFWTLKDSNAFGAMWNAKGKSHLYISAIKAVELADDFKFSDEFTLQTTYDAGTTLSLEKMLAASAKNPQAEVNYFITSPDGTKTAVTAESQLSLLKAGTWTLTAEMSGSVYGTAQKSFEVVIYEIDDLAFSADFAAEEKYDTGSELSLEKMVATSVKYPDITVTKYTVTDPEGKITEVTAQDTLTLSIAGTYTVKAVYDTLPYSGVAEKTIRVADVLATVESVNALINEILTADDITTMGEKAAQLRSYYSMLSDEEKETINFTSYLRAVNLQKENNTLYFLDTVDGKQQIEISCSISSKPTALETSNGVTFVTDVKHGDEAGSTKVEFIDVKTEWFEYFNIWLKKPSDIDLSQYAYVRFYIMGHTWEATRPLTLAVKVNGKRIDSMSTPVALPESEWYEVMLPVSIFAEGNKVELAFWTLKGNDHFGAMWNAKGKSHAYISAIKGVEFADDFKFSDEFTLLATYDAGTKLSLEKMLAASAKNPDEKVEYFITEPDGTKTAVTAESEIDLTKAGEWKVTAQMSGNVYAIAEKSFEVVIYEIDDLAFSVDFAAEEQYELNTELSLENMVATSVKYPELEVTKYTVTDPEGKVTEVTAQDTLTLSIAGTYTVKAVYDTLPYNGVVERVIRVIDALEAVESVNALIEEILSADDITSMGEKATQLRESYEALSDVGKEMVNFTSYVRASNLLKDNNTLYFLNTVDGKRQIEISCSISGVPTPLETNDGVTYVTDVKHSGEAGSTKIEFTDVKTEWFEYFNIWLKKPSDIDLSQYAYVRFYIMGHTWSAARPLTLAVKLNGKRIESMSTPVPIPSDEWYEILLPVSMFDEGNKVELAFWTLYGTNAYGSMWNAKGKSHAFISAIKGVESADDFEFSDEFTLQATYDAGTKLSLEKMLAASVSEPGATVTYFAVSPDKTKTAITAESEIDLTKAGIWTIVAVMNGEKYGTAEKSFEVIIYEIDDLAFSVDFAAEGQYELNAELSLENMVAASETYPDLTVTKYTVKDPEGRVTEITAEGTLTLSVAGTYTFKAVYDILPYSGSIEKQIKVVDSSDKNIYFAKTNSLLTGIVGKAYGNDNISNEYVEQFEGVKGVVKVCTDTESGASTNAWKWPGLGYVNALLSQDDIADYKSQGYKYVIVPIYYAGTKSVSLHYGISPNDKVADLENGKWNFVEIPLENVTKLADAYFLYINNESGGAPVDSKVITYYLASMYLAKEKPVLAFSSAEENAADMVTVTVGSATPAAEVCTDTVYGKEQSSIKFTVTEALSEVAYLNIDKQFSLEGYSRVFMYIRTTAIQMGLGIYNGNTRVIDFRHSYLPTDEWVKVEIPVSLLGEFEQMKLAFINYGWNTKIPAGTQFWISDIYVDIYAPLVLAPYGSDASGSGIKYSRLESFKGETDVLKCSTLTSEGAHNNSWKYPALRVYLNYTKEQLQALKDGGKSSLSFKIYIDNEAENTLKWGFGEYAVITTVTPGEWVKVDLNLDLLLENYDAVLKAGNTGYVFYIDNFSTNNHDLHFYIADMHVA